LEAQQLFVSAYLTCSLFSQETNISHLYFVRKRLMSFGKNPLLHMKMVTTKIQKVQQRDSARTA
jgi:hypothetical protein